MKNQLGIFMLMTACIACQPAATEQTQEVAANSAEQPTEQPPAKLLRHVVLFKFKAETSAENVKAIEDAFSALPAKIPQIHGYEWGLNNSPEGLNDEFTHCFFLTFKSEADRAVYLPHPDHKAFGALLGPHLDKVLVVDYWTK